MEPMDNTAQIMRNDKPPSKSVTCPSITHIGFNLMLTLDSVPWMLILVLTVT